MLEPEDLKFELVEQISKVKVGQEIHGNERAYLLRLSSNRPLSLLLVKMKLKLSVRELVESPEEGRGNDFRRLSIRFRNSHHPKIEEVKSSNLEEFLCSCSLIIGKKYRVTAKVDNQHIKGSPIEMLVEDQEPHDRKKPQGENLVCKRQLISPKMQTYYRELLTNTLQKCLPQSARISFLDVQSWIKVFDIPNANKCFAVDKGKIGHKQDQRGEVAVEMPIGICLLSNSFVVSTFKGRKTIKEGKEVDAGRVLMFERASGKYLREVFCKDGKPFERPADMVALVQGGFALRDGRRILISLDEEGSCMETFLENIPCYGLAQDKEGRLVCLEETKTRTALKFFNLDCKEVVKPENCVKLDALISNKADSKCRFLAHSDGRFFITDNGLNKVYVLDTESKDLKGSIEVGHFGQSGKGPGCFHDPGGVVVDRLGNIIVADSRNHRLCLFNKEKVFIRVAKTEPQVRRPSSVAFDPETGELYVLCLHGDSGVFKFKPKPSK